MECSYRRVAVTFTLFSGLLTAAPKLPVGFATGESDFGLGNSVVRNHATLFDGDAVQSLHFSTRMSLKEGSRFVLGIASQATIHRDHLALRIGSADAVNSGKPSRILAGSFSVSADAPKSTATVYVNDGDRVTVLVRSGKARVGRTGSTQVVTLAQGDLMTFRADKGTGIQKDTQGAAAEVARVQGQQLASLRQAAKEFTCLEPRVTTLSSSLASWSSLLAANLSGRSQLQTRIDAGTASAADLQQMTQLNAGMRSITLASGGLAADLSDMVLIHHVHQVNSPHTVHGHVIHYLHHGEHGHTEPGSIPPVGHHAGVPHVP